MSRVAVIGGGIAGATVALRSAEQGHEVTLLESGQHLGGLVVSFSVGGTPLECFYHHVFPHESHLIGLIDELGLSGKLAWLPSSMGVLNNGRTWPFTTPLDILRFGPLSPVERVRMGVGGLRLQRHRDWQSLDQVPAAEWLRQATGDAALRELWEPLLRAKFGSAAAQVPAAWMWGRFDQRRGARKRGGERLGYLRGGFKQVFEALAARLQELGVTIRTSSRVQSIAITDGRVTSVDLGNEQIEADAVVYTGALPGLARIVEEKYVDPLWASARGLGVICAVIETAKPITKVYWTNVCDDSLGIGGIIEHTNLLPASDYGGRHVTYIGRYFVDDEPIAKADPEEVTTQWLDKLQHIYPGFAASDILARTTFRTPYAAPLVTLGYQSRIPTVRAVEVEGLYVCTTAQIYPQDRGMSEGVRTGAAVAAMVTRDAEGR